MQSKTHPENGNRHPWSTRLGPDDSNRLEIALALLQAKAIEFQREFKLTPDEILHASNCIQEAMERG